MVLIVIDTQTHTQRTVMVPVKHGPASSEPAAVVHHPRFAQRS